MTCGHITGEAEAVADKEKIFANLLREINRTTSNHTNLTHPQIIHGQL